MRFTFARVAFCALAVTLLVLFAAAAAWAQYPLEQQTPQPAVSPAVVEVKGVKIEQQEKTLPVTGSDIAGLAILAGLLIAGGTILAHRRPSPQPAIEPESLGKERGPRPPAG